MRHAIAEATHDHESNDDWNRRPEESIQCKTALIQIVCITLVELFGSSRRNVYSAIAGLLVRFNHWIRIYVCMLCLAVFGEMMWDLV